MGTGKVFDGQEHQKCCNLYQWRECTIRDPIVKNPPVAEDNYCSLCIFLKKSNLWRTIVCYDA